VNKCQDCGKPSDESFTMDFTDVEPDAFIYWCSECGPEANAMNDLLQEGFRTRPGFAAKLEAEMDKVNQ